MKNKSSLIIIFSILLLSLVSFYLYKNKSGSSTLDKDARNFKIEDTASVTKIFLANKNGVKSTVKKTKTGWVVNDKYACRPEAIQVLLYTLKMLDVKAPVSKIAKPNIIKQMTANAVKIEVYSGNDLIKQYYVGKENQDHDATYMLLTDLRENKNFEDPFLMHIPGFNGFLSSRYIVDENEWRDKTVINYIPPQIKSITVENLESPDSSFVIKLKNSNQFELKKPNEEPLSFDEVKMKQYLAYFQNLQYEGLLNIETHKKLIDSLNNRVPFYRITVNDNEGKITTLHFIRKGSTPELNEKYGVNYVYDPDRLYLKLNNEKEMAVIQFYVFGKILQNYSYFTENKPVKK